MRQPITIALYIVGGLLLLGCIGFFAPKVQQKLFPIHFFSQPSVEATSSAKPETAPLIVYGYLPYWTRNKAVFSKTLTHVSYFSLGIQADGKLLDLPSKAQEAGYRAYQKNVLQELREKLVSEQRLELTLTMMDQDAIPLFLNSPEAQDMFLKDLQTIISSQPISGINIDIEYNGIIDPSLQEKLTTLLHRTNTLLKQHTPPMSLSIATYSDAGDKGRLTNLASIAPEVDYVIMMAYDFHRSKSPNAGPNAPLYGKSQGRWGEDILNDLQEYTQFIPPEKILLGIPFYGYAWSVEDASNPNSFTLPKTGESVPYATIKTILGRPEVERHWDDVAYSPYLRYSIGKTTKILYYDDPRSIAYKMQLVRQAGLRGVAIWALGYDEGDLQLWDTIQQYSLN